MRDFRVIIAGAENKGNLCLVGGHFAFDRGKVISYFPLPLSKELNQ